jgi:hypothetical protein
MTFNSSPQDLTNDLAPSSCNLIRQRIDINASFRELLQYVLAVAAIGGEDISDAAVIGKGLYGASGHGIDREQRCQCLDVKNVGGSRVLGARARP